MIYARYIKRCLDFALAVILSIVLIPIWFIISVAIVINSGRPIIYKQIRRGQFGQNFAIYKFRTMVNGADKEGTSTRYGDPRITPIGKFLRKTSLDELPQLLNVIRGNMSLVGFRPDVPNEDDDLTRDKWNVRAGITGYAQVNGRSNLTLEEVRYWEDKYAREITFILDLKILLKTVTVLLKKEGTN